MSKKIISLLLISIMLITPNINVYASKTHIQNEINRAESDLGQLEILIEELSNQQAAIAAKIDEANADLVDLLVQIDVTEASIADTEAEIEVTQGEIQVKTEELAVAEADKQKQYDNMKTRIRYIYENGGDSAWFKMILEVKDIASMLNRAEYVQNMHDYDRNMLAEFAAIVEYVKELKASLEEEKAILEEEKSYLETQKVGLQEQEAELQVRLNQMEAENADYAAKLSEARSQARSISNLIAEQEAELRRIEQEERRRAEEEERRRQEQAAAQNRPSNNNNSNKPSGTGSQTVPSFSGTATGSKIVAYADQFVGNPYVWGGNSLTNGIDCSHFVYQVLKNCGVYSGGYVTSAGWRSKGRAVSSLSEAQAGDVLCYSGHVAIYDGHGGIVEAQSSRAGITHNRSANYKTILAIRRFI